MLIKEWYKNYEEYTKNCRIEPKYKEEIYPVFPDGFEKSKERLSKETYNFLKQFYNCEIFENYDIYIKEDWGISDFDILLWNHKAEKAIIISIGTETKVKGIHFCQGKKRYCYNSLNTEPIFTAINLFYTNQDMEETNEKLQEMYSNIELMQHTYQSWPPEKPKTLEELQADTYTPDLIITNVKVKYPWIKEDRITDLCISWDVNGDTTEKLKKEILTELTGNTIPDSDDSFKCDYNELEFSDFFIDIKSNQKKGKWHIHLEEPKSNNWIYNHIDEIIDNSDDFEWEE